MKIGEVDSGSARLLCDKFLIIWSLLKGVKVIIHQSFTLLAKDNIAITNTVDLLLLDLFLVEQITVGGIGCRP